MVFCQSQVVEMVLMYLLMENVP